MSRPTPLVLSLLLLVAGPLAAQSVDSVTVPTDATRRHAVARRATGPIVLDGRLDDAAWAAAAPIGDFVRVRPDFIRATDFPSVVHVLFDDEHLYIGAFHRDTAGPRGLRMPDLRRDFTPPESDVFGITIGSLGDHRTVYQIQVTPLGSQGDVQAFDGGATFSFSWDAMWRVRTTQSDSGWVAEIAVPWTSLRYAPDLTTWDINFVRNSRRVAQWTAWAPYPRQFSSWRLAYAGVLDSIQPPPPRTNIRSRLYGLSSAAKDATPGARDGTTGDVGGEVIWAPTANSLVEATINTDFAQAEVDRQVVNLTRFSVFFPEQRQFFLENADLLTAGGGANGAAFAGGTINPFVVQPFFSRSIGLGADGTPRPIVGGLRYGYRTGRTAAGALLMRQAGTGATDADAADFAVGRLTQFVGRSTRIGGLVAYRDDAGDRRNVVTAVDALTRFGEATQLSAMLTTSADTGRTGVAATYALSRNTPSSNVGISGAYVSAEFRPRTGFVSRPDVIMTGPYASRTFQPAWRPDGVVWFRPEVFSLFFHDPQSKRLQEGSIALRGEVLRRTGGTLTPYVQQNYQRPTSALPILPGVAIAAGAYDYLRAGIDVSTDQSAPLAGTVSASTGGFFDGRQEQLALSGRWSPSPYLSVRATYEVNFLSALGPADTSLVTYLAGPELRLFLNPRLQWSAFYQYNSVIERGTLNARFSWEFSPLSFLYVVYNDRQPILGGLTPRARQLIVKLSWLRQL